MINFRIFVLVLLSTLWNTGTSSISSSHSDPTKSVVAELRNFVRDVVDPSITAIQANETRGKRTDCFGTTAGRLLRSRCCVYFSNVAGALLESKFGNLRPPRSQPLNLTTGTPPPLGITYQLTAKWVLAHANDPLALGVRAERVTSIEGFHQQAARLPGPLGRYSAEITVAGVKGSLVKCEMGTTHTYLVFRADVDGEASEVSESKVDDVIIDVTYRQFLVITEWMDGEEKTAELMDAAAAQKVFEGVPEWFVGTDSELADVLTPQGLQGYMERVLSAAGYESNAPPGHPQNPQSVSKSWGAPRPWLDKEELANMHHLRNEVMLTLNNKVARDRHCSKPNQAIGMA